MKKIVQRIMRSSIFQPLWKKLFHIAKVGMNYWGGGSFLHSGELNAFKKISSIEKKKILFFYLMWVPIFWRKINNANENFHHSNCI